ncbi:hypothetical protein FQN60_011564 [Scomber scombrus]|uniref:Ig-like domain-containing protein n=1 Tax=Scomber scombrus TaxID=13677 RepID=A0AAV1PG22_SCOSC
MGLYYCIADVNQHLTVGRGTMLQGFQTTAGFPMLFVPAKENVQFGSTVTLSCNISYIYDTMWLKQNPDLPPTEVLGVTFTGGKPHQEFQLSSRFSVELINRSLALKISDVEESDMGLYYCIANVNQHLTVGRGTMLQGSSEFIFKRWDCIVIGFVVLILLLAVFITHWRIKQKKRDVKMPSTVYFTRKD